MPNIIYKNIHINYSSIGNGSAIVLLHGFLENSFMWDDIIPHLSKRNKVITVDLFGHGKSENLGYIHTMEEQATMVKALLKMLNIRKATLIGHSMGGYVALAFAELFPKNTKGICLMNSTAYPDTAEKKINRDRAIEVVKQNHQTFVRLSIPLLFSEENQTTLKKEVEVVTSEALKISKQGIIASLEGMKIRKDRTIILKNTDFKKLLILGEKDTVLNYVEHQQQIKNTNTDLKILSQGHMSHIENNKELTFVLETFIKLQ
ncbi:MAG: alpha/beta hydrolase [Flavobacteriaceae bacterium]